MSSGNFIAIIYYSEKPGAERFYQGLLHYATRFSNGYFWAWLRQLGWLGVLGLLRMLITVFKPFFKEVFPEAAFFDKFFF